MPPPKAEHALLSLEDCAPVCAHTTPHASLPQQDTQATRTALSSLQRFNLCAMPHCLPMAALTTRRTMRMRNYIVSVKTTLWYVLPCPSACPRPCSPPAGRQRRQQGWRCHRTHARRVALPLAARPDALALLPPAPLALVLALAPQLPLPLALARPPSAHRRGKVRAVLRGRTPAIICTVRMQRYHKHPSNRTSSAYGLVVEYLPAMIAQSMGF